MYTIDIKRGEYGVTVWYDCIIECGSGMLASSDHREWDTPHSHHVVGIKINCVGCIHPEVFRMCEFYIVTNTPKAPYLANKSKSRLLAGCVATLSSKFIWSLATWAFPRAAKTLAVRAVSWGRHRYQNYHFVVAELRQAPGVVVKEKAWSTRPVLALLRDHRQNSLSYLHQHPRIWVLLPAVSIVPSITSRSLPSSGKIPVAIERGRLPTAYDCRVQIRVHFQVRNTRHQFFRLFASLSSTSRVRTCKTSPRTRNSPKVRCELSVPPSTPLLLALHLALTFRTVTFLFLTLYFIYHSATSFRCFSISMFEYSIVSDASFTYPLDRHSMFSTFRCHVADYFFPSPTYEPLRCICLTIS